MRRGWIVRSTAWRSGGEDSANSGLMVSRISRGRAARGVFPPEQVAAVKAVACELPIRYGLPLSRFSLSYTGW